MNEVMNVINSRRSVRSYAPAPLSEQEIKDIIGCGVRAPNGCNMQPLRFAVITDKDVMSRYNSIAKKMFGSYLTAQIKEDPPGIENLKHLKRMMDDPKYDMFYGAPCLILIFTAPCSMSPEQDSAVCAENMMLAAHSMGLGGCWIGFASPLGSDQQVLGELNVPADHKLLAQLVFGHPLKDTGVTPRNEPTVLRWI